MKQILVTADDTAEQLYISRRTLRYWVQHGFFPKPVYLGRRAFYTQSDIDAWTDRKLSERQKDISDYEQQRN